MATTRSAIFVVDIQHELAGDDKTCIPHADRVKSASERILTSARRISDSSKVETSAPPPPLLVFVQHEEDAASGTLVRGSEPWKLVFEPRANNENEILVAKTTREWSLVSFRSPHLFAHDAKPERQATHSSQIPTWRTSCVGLGSAKS